MLANRLRQARGGWLKSLAIAAWAFGEVVEAIPVGHLDISRRC